MIKFSLQLNEASGEPALEFQFNTASKELAEQTFRRFIALANQIGFNEEKVNELTLEQTDLPSGVSVLKINISPITP